MKGKQCRVCGGQYYGEIVEGHPTETTICIQCGAEYTWEEIKLNLEGKEG